MKTKLLWLLALLSLLFSAFPGICLAEKDYSPYVIEVQVSAGDTVSNLCDSRRIDYYAVKDAILIVNGFASEAALSAVSPGQTIYLPRSRADADSILALYHAESSAAIPASYTIKVTVQKGDTLSSICEDHHLTYSVCQEAIKKLNLWSSDSRLNSIYVGQELLLPSSDAAAAAITKALAEATTSNPASAAPKDTFEYYLIAHTMAPGETLQIVCSQLGILYSEEVAAMLRLINSLSDLSAASAGKTCLFPSKTPNNAAYQVYSHTVVFGDTIEKLCEAHQIRYADVRSLLQGLNPASSLAALRIGEALLLVSPAVSATVTTLASVSVPTPVSSPGAVSYPVSTPYPGSTSYPVPTSYPVSSPAFTEAAPEITITVK